VNDWYRESGRMAIADVANTYADIIVQRILGAR
jgi:hypothetical protein